MKKAISVFLSVIMLMFVCGEAVFALSVVNTTTVDAKGCTVISDAPEQSVISRQSVQTFVEKSKDSKTSLFDKIAAFFRKIFNFFKNLFEIIEDNDPPEKEPTPDASKFADKKIDILGDSITEQGKYIPLLESLTGASSIVNNGISGLKITQLALRVNNLSDDADLIIVFGGTNDYWHHDTAIGTISDSTNATFYGALNVLYNALKTERPNAEYLFIFPPHQTYQSNDDTHDFGYGTFNDFRVAMKTFCSVNGIKIFDLGTVTDWDPAVYTSDGVHPNDSGGTKLANEIYAFLQENF